MKEKQRGWSECNDCKLIRMTVLDADGTRIKHQNPFSTNSCTDKVWTKRKRFPQEQFHSLWHSCVTMHVCALCFWHKKDVSVRFIWTRHDLDGILEKTLLAETRCGHPVVASSFDVLTNTKILPIVHVLREWPITQQNPLKIIINPPTHDTHKLHNTQLDVLTQSVNKKERFINWTLMPKTPNAQTWKRNKWVDQNATIANTSEWLFWMLMEPETSIRIHPQPTLAQTKHEQKRKISRRKIALTVTWQFHHTHPCSALLTQGGCFSEVHSDETWFGWQLGKNTFGRNWVQLPYCCLKFWCANFSNFGGNKCSWWHMKLNAKIVPVVHVLCEWLMTQQNPHWNYHWPTHTWHTQIVCHTT